MHRSLSSTPEEKQKREQMNASKNDSPGYIQMVEDINRGRAPQEDKQRAENTSAMGDISGSMQAHSSVSSPVENVAGSVQNRVMPAMTGEQPNANVPASMQERTVEPPGQPSIMSDCNIL